MVVRGMRRGHFPPSHPEWDNPKWVYVEDGNGVFLGKVKDTPRHVFTALKKGGVGVVSTKDHTENQCVMTYYK